MQRTINNKPFYYLIIFSILAIASMVMIILNSCYTPKKADKQINKALQHYPDKVATIARNAFPCVPLKSDTVISYIDTIIQVTDTIIERKNDTIFAKVQIKSPVTIQQKIVTIIKKVEDSAKIYLLKKQIGNLQIDTAFLHNEVIFRDQRIANLNDKIKDLKKDKLKLIITISILLLIIILYFYIKSKKILS